MATFQEELAKRTFAVHFRNGRKDEYNCAEWSFQFEGSFLIIYSVEWSSKGKVNKRKELRDGGQVVIHPSDIVFQVTC